MKNVSDIEHIDASRRVCLDCEGLMHEHGVTTDTPKSGKRSRNRLNKRSDPDIMTGIIYRGTQ